MFKYFDHLDEVFNGEIEPSPFDVIVIILLIPTILLTGITMIWLAAYIVEIYGF